MAKKRKTSAASATPASAAKPNPPRAHTQPPSSPPRYYQPKSSSFLTNVTAVFLTILKMFSEGGKNTKLLTVVAILLVFFIAYLFVSWILIPVFSVLMYPLFPVKWVFMKVYFVVMKILSLATAAFKAIAMVGFYLYFFLKFWEYVADSLHFLFSAIQESRNDEKTNEGEDENSHRDVPHYDNEDRRNPDIYSEEAD